MSASLAVARTIYYGFQSMFADFQGITLGARARFEQRDWHGVHKAQADRTDIYRNKVAEAVLRVQQVGDEMALSIKGWRNVRNDFAQLIQQLPNGDIAESFYNSVLGKLHDHKIIGTAEAFITPWVQVFSMPPDPTLLRGYTIRDNWQSVLQQLLEDFRFGIDYQHAERDISKLLGLIRRRFGSLHNPNQQLTAEVLDAVFYRNKGAYIVGRVLGVRDQPIPFLIALMNGDKGIYVDSLITDTEELSIIFSFTRAYFMVDSPVPAHIVAFLSELMPLKRQFELYSSVGFRKHAKTVLYRDIFDHLAKTDDQFIEAPGIRGMVMLVFTLPSYDAVFKLIKDRFTPPKDVTEAIVREKYLLVTKHDRAGRMADTQEFNGMRLPRNRFAPALLAQLLEHAPSKVEFSGDDIVIKHMYTERRMVPLNMYVSEASEQQLDSAMREYGQAIKDLAAANIFPGDMLLKNFGVTRHGRVVFYDYDELCYLTDCNFRAIPEATTPEQEMASSPWYAVAANDVFPEEFRLFFSGKPAARKAFEKYHADLYDPALWQQLQEIIRAGVVLDVYPYRRTGGDK